MKIAIRVNKLPKRMRCETNTSSKGAPVGVKRPRLTHSSTLPTQNSIQRRRLWGVWEV